MTLSTERGIAMMLALTLRAAKSTTIGSAVALALVAGLLAAPAHAEPIDRKAEVAAAIPDAPDCPVVLPTSSVRPGMTGEGLTVVRGATPQAFAVEVLGVLENGISSGRDMIIIEASDLPGGQVISAGGGIWGGMSGSPVYIDGKLLGAVAWGFTAAPSPIGGVTPAADMLDLLSLPNPAGSAAGRHSGGCKQEGLAARGRPPGHRGEGRSPGSRRSLEQLTAADVGERAVPTASSALPG